jgi:hypothetical protein
MPRSKGDGSKSSIRVRPGTSVHRMTAKNWSDLEKHFRVSLPGEVRAKIEVASDCYAGIGKLHSPKESINTKTAIKALDAWIKASGRFQISLGKKSSVAKLSRIEIISNLCGEGKRKSLEKMSPLGFFGFMLDLAMGAASTAIAEIPGREFGPEIKGDMWLVWVRLIVVAVSQVGAKTTASSSNLASESSFVEGVLYLQALLPDYCKRFKTYDSVVKGVQLARKKFGHADEFVLMGTMMGLGSGVIDKELLSKLSDLRHELGAGKTGY